MVNRCGIVIGNGESRAGVDLTKIPPFPTFGCNALYRDYSPDVLFSRDSDMLREIKDNYDGVVADYSKPFMSWDGWLIEIPKEVVFAGSVALWCMLKTLELDTVYLLGFDPYPINGDEKNNIYKGTPNYGGTEERAFPRLVQCVKDLRFIFDKVPNVTFVRVGEKAPVRRIDLRWELMTYQEFLTLG